MAGTSPAMTTKERVDEGGVQKEKERSMSAAEILGIGNEAILVALRIGAPVMLLALAVGLAISVLQALTQIQEMTLTFVPKILVIMLSLLLLLPVMLATLTSFTQSLFQRMATG